MSGPVKIVLFCGGRGSATIIRALLRRTDVELTLIVNAYDDGLSTGALRSFIPGMLGPSDFRKNLSYLLGNYSNAQYALKHLLEYRIPDRALVARLAAGDPPEPLRGWLAEMPPRLAGQVRTLLAGFFDHAGGAAFDYRDCSLGNLVFAGAYLKAGRDFNQAAAEMGRLVDSRATLLNVSQDQNRVLVGLKMDGAVLTSEAEIVGAQSPAPITNLYLLERPLTAEDHARLETMNETGKREFLAARHALPALSRQAADALATADIVLYGPGTQFSSLLPSYMIAGAALAASPAPVKALVINLDTDHDIQSLTASDVADLALAYGAPVSDILRNDEAHRLPPGALTGGTYRGAAIHHGPFAQPFRPERHSGRAVATKVLALYHGHANAPSVEIFADIHNRSIAADEIAEEFLETNWHAEAHLTLNRVAIAAGPAPIVGVNLGGLFPELGYFRDWLANGTSDYLVLMTGDGAYRFDDVQAIIALMEQQPSLGIVSGSRTQSRRQFITSIRAAYGEHRFLYALGKAAAFFLSMIFYFRTGVIVSDPLTGLRVFRRRALPPQTPMPDTPLELVRRLVKAGVEVAELPVLYRTFSGFTDPKWRMRRGLRNLMGVL